MEGKTLLIVTDTGLCPMTYGHAGNQFYLQKDGNLVVYDSNRNPLWHAKSYGHEQGTKQLCLTDDGELYIKWKKNWYSSSKIFSSYEKGVQITQNDPKLKLVGEYKYDHASLGMRQCDSTSYIKIHYPDGNGKMKVELNYFWSPQSPTGASATRAPSSPTLTTSLPTR